MAQVFAAFGKFGQNNKGSIQNFGIIGVTIGSEELMKFIFFYCPCNYPMNEVYGTTFIWGPAAILLVVGYVINRRTWRLTTGMCNRTQGVGKGCKRVFHFLFIFLNISMKAILAPATWIVIAFLKGDYYACAAWPAPGDPNAHAKFGLNKSLPIPPPCYFKAKPIPFDRSVPESIARDLRAYSHIIGWWFLIWALMIGIFMMFVFRCMSKYSYEQSKYIEKYRSSENDLFEEGLDTKARAQAKIVVDQYFSKPRSKEEWDQIASINDKVMRSKRGRPIYSPMHKFVNKELVALELAQDDIVNSSAKKKHHLSSIINKKKKTAGWPTTAALNANKKSAPHSVQVGSAPPAPRPANAGSTAASIPMVAMLSNRPGKVVLKAPKKAVDLKEGTHVQMDDPPQREGPQTTETTAEIAPPVPPKDMPEPDLTMGQDLEQDPILEANIPDRGSHIAAVVDMDEDPIKEANITEQADEIRQSREDLTAQNGYEENEDEGNQIDFGGDEGDDYDSQPLLK